MGLSGRKTKQRIPNDPRNLSWADNAAKFGQTYLSKFGWDTSQGLGASGEGRTTAVQVSQKLDMLGIGMQHQRDPNGLAWRQNRDFENLLKRLNEGGEAQGPFHKAREDDADVKEGDDKKEEDATVEKEGKVGKSKKRKAEETADTEVEDKKERKRRRREEKAKKKAKGEDSALESASVSTPETPMPVAVVPIVAPIPARVPPRSHRARNIAAKRLASCTPSALSEILGIPSSSSTPAPVSTVPTSTLEPMSDMHTMERLTTSTQSVADYFKAKLQAKMGTRSSSLGAATPERGSDYDDTPKMGLGMSRRTGSEDDVEPVRTGIGATSMFSAMFTQAREVKTEPDLMGEEALPAVIKEEADQSNEDRRRAKEEKRRKKAERKALKVEGDTDRGALQMEVDDGTALDGPPETLSEKTKSRKKKTKDDSERKRKRSE
ncbi:hypothetical protein OF83DRAFT_422024 [Amylostereum chailletii]|nr:hypothetical protein OF83DRAFT_422024 [Amylostereum chailletii]